MIDHNKLFELTKELSVLFVEDYAPLREELGELLEDYFQTVVYSSDGKSGLDAYKKYYHTNNSFLDIVISDIQMPIVNGVDLSKNILSINKKQKIIILSAYTEGDDLVRLINIGVSRFVQKPIENDTLFDSIHQVCKDISKETSKQISLNPASNIVHINKSYIWDSDKKLLLVNEKNIELSQHETLLLNQLVQHKNHLCSNTSIIQEFYMSDIDISKDSIRNLIYKLRKKLPKNTISSMYGAGYRLNIKS